MVKKIENRGGARPNTGPKPKQPPDYDAKFKKAVIRAANKLRKKYGMPIEEAVLELVYKADTQDSVKAAVWKTLLEIFTVKKTESKTENHDFKHGPIIGLPPVREDPSLKVHEGGKE